MSTTHFWQFCDMAQCLPSSPDISLRMIHKNYDKHPRKHELRAAWVVERALKIANVILDLDAVIAASKQEEIDYKNASKRVVSGFKFRI